MHLCTFSTLVTFGNILCVKQNTISTDGSQSHKFRMTHDQSFPGPSGTSVNLWTVNKELPPIVYGFCLKRIIHYILNLRLHHPTSKIYISKFDFDAAYTRCHTSHTTAQESLTIHSDFLLKALCLTFGGSPCPNLWGYLSEPITDLSNLLIQLKSWNHLELYNPSSRTAGNPNLSPGRHPTCQDKGPFNIHPKKWNWEIRHFHRWYYSSILRQGWQCEKSLIGSTVSPAHSSKTSWSTWRNPKKRNHLFKKVHSRRNAIKTKNCPWLGDQQKSSPNISSQRQIYRLEQRYKLLSSKPQGSKKEHGIPSWKTWPHSIYHGHAPTLHEQTLQYSSTIYQKQSHHSNPHWTRGP